MLRQLGILYDVSNSMKSPFNIFQGNDPPQTKSDYLIHMMNKIIKDKNIHIFTLLFGGKKNAEIFDYISYIEKMNIYLSKLNIGKENKRNSELTKEISSGIENKHDEKNYLTDLNKAFILKLIHQNDSNLTDIENIFPFLTGIKRIISFFDVFKLNDRNININNCIEELFQKIYEQMKNDNNIKIIKSNELKPILEKMDELIEKYIPHYHSNENRNFLYYLKDKIYGESRLAGVCEGSLKLFSINKNKYHQQMLIIVTDGSINDIDELKGIFNELKKNNVYVLICYISNFSSKHMLYDKIENTNINEEKGKKLFELSSKIYWKDPISKCFLSNGWIIKTKNCRLFIGVNNEKSMTEFISLVNSLLTFEEKTFNNIINELGKMSLSSFIYSYNMNLYRPKQQIFGTCWANACAACIYLKRMTVIGRKEESLNLLEIIF